MKKKRHKQVQKRYFDPSVEPMGPPKIIGEGTSARVGKESRQLKRAAKRNWKNK